MTETFGGTIDQCCSVLKLDFSSAELAQLTLERGFSQDTLNGMAVLFEYLREKKEPACEKLSFFQREAH